MRAYGKVEASGRTASVNMSQESEGENFDNETPPSPLLYVIYFSLDFRTRDLRIDDELRCTDKCN